MVTIRKKKLESAEEKAARLQKEQESSMGIQDEYQAKGFELVSFVQDNKGKVATLIAVALLSSAAFSAYLFYQKRSAQLASIAYIETMQILEEKPKEGEDSAQLKQRALLGLKQIATTHKNSNISVLANLYAGHLAMESDDGKAALECYQAALSRVNSSDNLFALATIGLAYAYEKSGDKVQALAHFEKIIAAKDASGKDLALYEAARLLSENKEFDKVNGYIARLNDEYPSSVYQKNAKRLKETNE